MKIDTNDFEVYSDLYLFVEVVNVGGINKAARKLNLQSSKISRRIKMLESKLKQALLTRNGNTLELTSFGNKIYHLFAEEYVLANNKLNVLNDDSYELAGTINLFIPPIFAQKAIAGDLNKFLAKYPQLQINFSVFNFSALYNHAFDLAISTQMPENESYLVRKLYSCSKMLFAAPKYTTEYGMPVNITELAEHKLLLDIHNGSATREINLFDKNGEVNQFVITNSNLAFDNLFYGLEMVLHGYGICVLPYFMAKPHLVKGELVRVLPEYIANEFSFYLIRPNIKITKKENEVVKFLQHIIEQYFDVQE